MPKIWLQPTPRYYAKMADAFLALVASSGDDGNAVCAPLTFDGANGVGAVKMAELAPSVASVLQTTVVCDGTPPGVLNAECGADFVKTTQGAPVGLDVAPLAKHCSVDGDADRLVYYYHDDGGVFHLIDGDKIAALFAVFVTEVGAGNFVVDYFDSWV